ncbi:MAG TPA: AEC family transporter [Candidatus Nanopelagicales bacterium]|nr:AEC family transporter [Candidatus Nanopelagicales bacterium]
MAGVLNGFGIIAVVIGIGYLAGRLGFITPQVAPAIAKLVFFVLAPCLLFTILARTDVAQVFSGSLGVALVSAVTVFGVYAVVARALWHRSVAATTLGALTAGYVNSNNIGLPVSVYMLGSAAYVAPVLLVQLVVMTPVALTLLDASTSGRVSLRHVLGTPVRNPLVVASLLGVLASVSHVTVPDVVFEPLRIVGAAAVPLMLMNFGASLHGARVLRPGPERKDVVLATSLKAVVMPLVAWLLGAEVLGLGGHALFVVVALAALPAAQNTFTFAQRYGVAEVMVRDAILLTTVASVPVLLAAAFLLS